jgi:molecular chaperone HtpG
LKKNLEVQKDKIQLYSNQVFVTDSVEGIVPEFLTLLHGVIDSPDIPLNVSRSYLQSDRNVKKISNHISKKVADKLEEIFKNNREEMEQKWDDIKVFIEYGMISDEKFYERATKFALLKNVDGKYFTFDEYKEQVKDAQTDKDKKIVYLYSNDQDEQYAYIQAAKDKGYDVLDLDGVLDNHFINSLEQKFSDIQFKRVDAETAEKLIDKDEKLPSKLDEKQQEELKPVIEKNIDKAKFSVVFESLSETEAPFMITQSEFMRRMKDMEKLGGGGMMGLGGFPDSYNLVVNSNHPLIMDILEDKEEESQQAKVKQMYDLALLSQSLLKGKELSDFIKRSFSLIK